MLHLLTKSKLIEKTRTRYMLNLVLHWILLEHINNVSRGITVYTMETQPISKMLYGKFFNQIWLDDAYPDDRFQQQYNITGEVILSPNK